MPITFVVDRAKDRITATASGPVTFDDIRHHLETERAARGLTLPELIDGRGAVPVFTSDDVRRVVDWLRAAAKTSALGPTAVVVGSDVGYGMMRMLEILLDDTAEVRPFRTVDEANTWLTHAGA